MSLAFDGVDGAIAAFDLVDEALQSGVVQEALGELAEAGRARAAALAPVYAGPPERDVVPGELQERVFAHSYEKAGVPAALFGVRTEEVPYAADVEFGNQRDPAQPFLRPAFDELARDADAVVAERIGKLLD